MTKRKGLIKRFNANAMRIGLKGAPTHFKGRKYVSMFELCHYIATFVYPLALFVTIIEVL